MKYPYDQNNKKKQEFTEILSSLAVAADRLISFYDEAVFQCETSDDIDSTISEPEVETDQAGEQTLEDKMRLLF